VVDGILNALTLAAEKILEGHDGVSPSLALKVGVAAASTTVFVFFVAHYAAFRTELVHAEKELNLLSHGRMAMTTLGGKILRESLLAALLASVCGFIGAAAPLLLSVILPGPPILGLAATVVMLGLFGVVLAGTFCGSRLTWALTLMAGGIVLTFVGVELNIVG
jgi:VIT1/CCC1 family predicted Fe2+/Mn2+ transporter